VLVIARIVRTANVKASAAAKRVTVNAVALAVVKVVGIKAIEPAHRVSIALTTGV
jgi:hypothetical protein